MYHFIVITNITNNTDMVLAQRRRPVQESNDTQADNVWQNENISPTPPYPYWN